MNTSDEDDAERENGEKTKMKWHAPLGSNVTTCLLLLLLLCISFCALAHGPVIKWEENNVLHYGMNRTKERRERRLQEFICAIATNTRTGTHIHYEHGALHICCPAQFTQFDQHNHWVQLNCYLSPSLPLSGAHFVLRFIIISRVFGVARHCAQHTIAIVVYLKILNGPGQQVPVAVHLAATNEITFAHVKNPNDMHRVDHIVKYLTIL